MPAPFITVTIAGREFAALLDTGASASLFGDDVFALLQQRSVCLRECRATFSLASGTVRAAGAARLTVHWDGRVGRFRFIRLPGLTVPVILGRDFLRKSRIVVHTANGGYRTGPLSVLKRFASPPPPRMVAPSQRASPLCRAVSRDLSPAQTIAALRDGAFHPLIAGAVGLEQEQKARMSDSLFRYGEMFTDEPGYTDLVRHKIETGDALPLKSNPRPVSLSKRRAIDGVLDEMLATAVVQR